MPAATIGPIVCDELGPIPTLNMSKTDKNICILVVIIHSVDHVCLIFTSENTTFFCFQRPQ